MMRLQLLVLAVLACGACSKPSTENCRKALANMKHLMGTENLHDEAALEGEVRRCKGGSTRKAVSCAIDAQTLDQLRACDFYKVPANARGVGGPGSSAGSGSGSAAMGSGSAGTGSGAGSGSADMTGSAGSGSAAMTGSAGSAAGSGSAGSGSAAIKAAGSGSAAGSAK